MDLYNQSTDSETSEEEQENIRPGVRRGVKRGKYRKTQEEKSRVIEAALNDEDWRAVATANGVPHKTAYGWLRRYNEEQEPTCRQRGGANNMKLTERHRESMLKYIEEDHLITLKTIKCYLLRDHGINVSTTTIHKHLDCQFYSIKKVLPQPSSMNSEENKRKRANYVSSVMSLIGRGKYIIYIDETNCNLFLRRSFGRSKKGLRCCVKVPTSKGKNVHVIAGISQTGLIYWERRRGSYRKDDCCQWLRSLLRHAQEPMNNIVVVCDNAPVHCSLEHITEEEEFTGVSILRLAPYSAPLNPVEECWSVMKAEIKKSLNSSMQQLLNTPPPAGTTQTEQRLLHLESIIDASIVTITPNLCMKTCNHVQRHYQNCLSLTDLNMGDNVH